MKPLKGLETVHDAYAYDSPNKDFTVVVVNSVKAVAVLTVLETPTLDQLSQQQLMEILWKTSAISYQEFQNFNSNQRNKIMELHRDRKFKASSQSNTHDNALSVKLVASTIIKTISKAIVAGVEQATQDNADDTAHATTESGERKADSGSVGSFIKNRRNNMVGENNPGGTLSRVMKVMSLIIELIYYTCSLFIPCQNYQNNNGHTLSTIHVDSTNSHVISDIHLTLDDRRLGIDSHDDMSCARKHTRIIGIEEGQVSTV